MKNSMPKFNRLRSLTVDELIEELQQYSDDGHGSWKVVMTADYGDYSHTTQALEVSGIKATGLCESGYSNSGFAVDEDSEELVVSIV